MGILSRLKSLVQGDPTSGNFSSTNNFVCPGCRETYKREHKECPNCGSKILVPIEETDVEDNSRRGPFS